MGVSKQPPQSINTEKEIKCVNKNFRDQVPLRLQGIPIMGSYKHCIRNNDSQKKPSVEMYRIAVRGNGQRLAEGQ